MKMSVLVGLVGSLMFTGCVHVHHRTYSSEYIRRPVYTSCPSPVYYTSPMLYPPPPMPDCVEQPRYFYRDYYYRRPAVVNFGWSVNRRRSGLIFSVPVR